MKVLLSFKNSRLFAYIPPHSSEYAFASQI
jgi:hypothetical protein